MIKVLDLAIYLMFFYNVIQAGKEDGGKKGAAADDSEPPQAIFRYGIGWLSFGIVFVSLEEIGTYLYQIGSMVFWFK